MSMRARTTLNLIARVGVGFLLNSCLPTAKEGQRTAREQASQVHVKRIGALVPNGIWLARM